MFTGIIEDTAEVSSIEDAGEGKRMVLQGSEAVEETLPGGSVSVSGACLTVESSGDEPVFFLAEETLEKTWFDRLEEGDLLNIERPLTPEDRMGGHVVQGHVEAAVEVTDIDELEKGWNLSFEKPETLDPYIVEKGFIAVEGISLTVTEVAETRFSVTVIPETWEATSLSEVEEGDRVNLETDVMARYMEKMAASTEGF
ncbi:MAG: riboflavin synthase [Candidatus Nanosalina sp.]